MIHLKGHQDTLDWEGVKKFAPNAIFFWKPSFLHPPLPIHMNEGIQMSWTFKIARASNYPGAPPQLCLQYTVRNGNTQNRIRFVTSKNDPSLNLLSLSSHTLQRLNPCGTNFW